MKACDIARLQGVGLTHLPAQARRWPSIESASLKRNGHFLGAIELICTEDETAKQYAKQLVDGHDAELWQQDRRIAKFPS